MSLPKHLPDPAAAEISTSLYGALNGVGNNLFEPNRAIKREEMATIFSRYITNMNIVLILFARIIGILWIIAPSIMYYISKAKENKKSIEYLTTDEIEYTKKIAKDTWEYFNEYMNKENNFLPPDNFQESRREKVVSRTSATNIGLGLLVIISSYDLKFITLEKALINLENSVATIEKLDKWNRSYI